MLKEKGDGKLAAFADLSAGLQLKQDFLALVEKQYGVRPKGVLGKDIKEVNDWVAQQTGRKVQGLLASNFPRNAGANAVSAAYFKGRPGSARRDYCSSSSQPSSLLLLLLLLVFKQGSG